MKPAKKPIFEIIDVVKNKGISLKYKHPNGIECTPSSRLTDDIRQLIKCSKSDIIEWLKTQPNGCTVAANEGAFEGSRTRSKPLETATEPSWSSQEIELFSARFTRFMGAGIGPVQAESLAQKLLNRDRDLDDRRACIECGNRTMAGQCRTGQAAGVALAGRGQSVDIRAIQTKLQRCDGFKGVVS